MKTRVATKLSASKPEGRKKKWEGPGNNPLTSGNIRLRNT